MKEKSEATDRDTVAPLQQQSIDQIINLVR